MICFIINEAAVKKKLEYVNDTISRFMDKSGIPYALQYTKYPEHATELSKDASKKGFEKVIAVGGDGTVLETVSGLHNSESYFGVIPMGSGNDFVKSIGMKNFNIFDALEVICYGKVVNAVRSRFRSTGDGGYVGRDRNQF